nr:hypothetical protein [Phytoactinopolyspora limicola]
MERAPAWDVKEGRGRRAVRGRVTTPSAPADPLECSNAQVAVVTVVARVAHGQVPAPVPVARVLTRA